MQYRIMARASLCLFIALTAACDSGSTPEDTFTVTYELPFNASNFDTGISNPFFPMEPGMTKVFEGQTEEGLERIEIEVLEDTRMVAGVQTRVIRDRVYVAGDLVEDTFDWFATDNQGNVWYLGEDSKEIENGQVLNSNGSWEAGIDGAVAGIIIPASPTVGQAYYQEFYAGEAEDRGKVVGLNEAVTVEAGSYSGCLKTEDTTPLEPDVLEYKYYCPGVGVVLEENIGDDERIELIEITMPTSQN